MDKLDLILTAILCVVFGIVIGAVGSILDTHHLIPPPKGAYVGLLFDANSLQHELGRCRQLGRAAYDDAQCQLAWTEIRDQPDGCTGFSMIGAMPPDPTPPSGH